MNKTARNWEKSINISFVNQIDETNLQSMQDGARRMFPIVEELLQDDPSAYVLGEAKTNFENVTDIAEDAEEAMEYFDLGLKYLADYGDANSVWFEGELS